MRERRKWKSFLEERCCYYENETDTLMESKSYAKHDTRTRPLNVGTTKEKQILIYTLGGTFDICTVCAEINSMEKEYMAE